MGARDVIRRFIPTRRFTMWFFTATTAILVVAWYWSMDIWWWEISDAEKQTTLLPYLRFGNVGIQYWRGIYIAGGADPGGLIVIPWSSVGGYFDYVHDRGPAP